MKIEPDPKMQKVNAKMGWPPFHSIFVASILFLTFQVHVYSALDNQHTLRYDGEVNIGKNKKIILKQGTFVLLFLPLVGVSWKNCEL